MLLLTDLLFPFTGQREQWLSQEQGNALLLGLLLVAAFFLPRARLASLRPIENFVNRLAQHPRLVILCVGIFAFILNALISILGQWPIAAVQDEFSYLLAADTFARARLTNPSPPVWIPFETFHVILQPTYASKYPPGQGLMLAIGQVLTGSPIVGSWIGTAFACMAICWMLYQWLPSRWALTGGVLLCLHPTMIFWTQSFWGCQWVVAGSALALGGLRVFQNWQSEDPRRLHLAGWVVGVGIALMLITRPSEGGVLSLMILATLISVAVRAKRCLPLQVATIGLCIVATLGFQGYNNYRTTGDPKVLPYVVHEEAYGYSPLFVWQKFRTPPEYHHAVIRDMHLLDEPPDYIKEPSLWRSAEVLVDKTLRFVLLHSQLTVFGIALLAIPWLLRHRNMSLLPTAFLLGVAAFILLEVWLLPHYTTAMVPLGVLLTMAGLRALRAWQWHGRHGGLFLVRATVLVALLSPVTTFAGLADPNGDGIIYEPHGVRQFARLRQRFVNKLEAIPGRHLVIVHYQRDHIRSREWVFNSADLWDGRVLWARASTPERDRQLVEFYRGQSRRVWLLDADDNPPRLRAWPESG